MTIMSRHRFQAMWEGMQAQGYFPRHPHYAMPEGESQLLWPAAQPDPLFQSIDFEADEVRLPGPYGVELERAIKRSEPYWLSRMFPIPAGGTALDLGCGYGRSLAWLRERFDGVVGVDISRAALDLAQTWFGSDRRVRLVRSSGDGLPDSIGDGTIDFIYCFTVFQHIPRRYTRRYLRACRRALKPGGVLVFNVLSGRHEAARTGVYGTEWAIGFSRADIERLTDLAGLRVRRICRWTMADAPGASWLWICAGP